MDVFLRVESRLSWHLGEWGGYVRNGPQAAEHVSLETRVFRVNSLTSLIRGAQQGLELWPRTKCWGAFHSGGSPVELGLQKRLVGSCLSFPTIEGAAPHQNNEKKEMIRAIMENSANKPDQFVQESVINLMSFLCRQSLRFARETLLLFLAKSMKMDFIM